MRPLKLHIKTTLIAVAIMLAVLAGALWLISERVAGSLQKEQRELAEMQAINLAEQISRMPTPRDRTLLERATTLVGDSYVNVIVVRIWERTDGAFAVVASSNNSPAPEIPKGAKAALINGVTSQEVSKLPNDARDSQYRVFAPIIQAGQVNGTVEVINRLDDARSIALKYQEGALWLGLAAVAVTVVAIYLLFRRLIYRPIERLLRAMSRAKAGDLEAEAPVTAADELGVLSREYNDLIKRLRLMTSEREMQKVHLQERVHEATAELEERNRQLEETNLELWQTTRRLTELERLAAAGQTAAQFAHEVGTPLNLIGGHVQLLRAASAHDPAAQARLETISTQIERIERIVRQMLDRTRPEPHDLAPVALNALLGRIFEATAPMLEARGVTLTEDLSASLPSIPGDVDRLQQVFINLFNNALDAMPSGGKLRVSTCATENEHAPEVVVEFGDTGCGMTPEVRAHIFDPLFTTKERGRGAGLGLVVVNQVMKDHSGQIEVESSPLRGTVFRLRFPIMASPASSECATLSESSGALR